jgi:hypothetical protein
MASGQPGTLDMHINTALRWSAFAIAFLSIGLPYWAIPYSRVTLPDALPIVGLLVVAVAAGVVRACRASTLWRAALTVGSAVPAAVLARVLVEGLHDPTSHNLWPFELVIAAAYGFPPALAGAALGVLIGGPLVRPAARRKPSGSAPPG